MITFLTHTNKHVRIRNKSKSYTIKSGLEHVRFVESVLNEVYPTRVLQPSCTFRTNL